MRMSLKKKYLTIFLLGAILVLFARTVPQLSLSQRAIVVGLGIDGVQNNYTVSAQMINPLATGQENATNDTYGIVSASGKTLSECLDKIAQKVGLDVSLAHCNVLILGKELVDSNVLPSINYLVSEHQLPGLGAIAATDISAKELLKSKLIMSAVSAFQIQQELLTNQDKSAHVLSTVKQFMVNLLSRSKAVMVPLITKAKVSPDDLGSANKEEEYDELYYSKAALFSEGKPALILDEESTVGYNYVTNRAKKGEFTIEYQKLPFSLNFNSKKTSKKTNFQNGKAQVVFSIELTTNVNEAGSFVDYFSGKDLTPDVMTSLKDLAEKQIKEQIANTYLLCKDAGYDVFSLNDLLYSWHGNDWAKVAENPNYLDFVDLFVEVDVTVVRN